MTSKRHEEPTNPEIKFPILMEYKDKSFVVLFESPTNGVIMHNESKKGWKIGEFHKSFYSADNTEFWHPFQGSITLSN